MGDPYKILGIDRTASPDDIKKAYKKLSKKYHPDSSSGNVDLFKEVQEAYDILSNPTKKQKNSSRTYWHAKQPVNPTSGFNYNDIVNEFFGGSNFKGRSIQFRVEISLKEVLTGCTKPITIKRRKKCLTCAGTGITGFSSCKNCQGSGFFKTQDSPFELQQACMVCGGTGKSDIVKCKDCLGQGFMVATEEKTINVKIPPGIENGMQIRIVGEGEPSLRHGGKAGDVIVFVLVKDFAPFSREGANLTLEVPVSYGQLCLGDSVEIPTLNEGVYLIKIPPGSQPNTKFRIKGKGLPIGGSFGDLIATVKVEVPKNLDEEYRKVLESLIKMEKEFITPRRKAWSEAKYEQVH